MMKIEDRCSNWLGSWSRLGMTFSQTTAVKYASRSSPFSLSSASEEEEEDCGKDCSLFWAQASSLAQEVGAVLGRVFQYLNFRLELIWGECFIYIILNFSIFFFFNFSILVIWGEWFISFSISGNADRRVKSWLALKSSQNMRFSLSLDFKNQLPFEILDTFWRFLWDNS